MQTNLTAKRRLAQVTRFESVTALQGITNELQWPEEFTRFRRSETKDGACIVPGLVTGRGSESVQTITLAMFDCDGVAFGGQTRSLLEADEIESVAYTTFSHSAEAPCYRLALSLSRPVTPAEWAKLRAGLIAKYVIDADPATGDAGRLYYLPTARPGGEAVYWYQEGQPVDVEALLASAPAVTASHWPRQRTGDQWFDLIGEIKNGGRDNTLASLAGKLFALAPALPPELAFALLNAVNEARCKPPLDAADVARIAKSIASKHARGQR